MRSKPVFIGRTNELEWLKRTAKFSPAMVVVGVRGIGKTWLVRHWVEASGWKCKWFSADRLKSLSEILGREGDPESALEQVAGQWAGLDAVIWDDIEQIHPKSRNTLLSFLRATPGLPLQVLISDEEISRDLLADLSQLKLGPFDNREIQDFLSAVGESGQESILSEPVSEIERKTGGVPLLLRLWLQSPDAPADLIHSVLGELSSDSTSLFGMASTLGRAADLDELGRLSNLTNVNDLTDELCRKNLMEKVLGARDSYRVPAFIRNLYLKELGDKRRGEFKRRLLTRLRAAKDHDLFEIFLLAIDIGDMEAINLSVMGVTLERLESLGTSDLREVLRGIESGYAAIASQEESGARYARLYMRVLFLLGMRSEALKAAEKFTGKIDATGPISQEQQHFILEYTQLLNRTSQFEKAKKTAKNFISRFEDPIFSLLSVELGVSIIPTSLKEAMEILEKTLRKAESTLASGERSRDWLVVRTLAHFQLGRSQDLADDWRKSERHFAVAHDAYKEDLGQTYFASVSAMNRAWLIFQQMDWERLTDVLLQVRSEAEKFGYHYVLAGASIIEAGKCRYFMQAGAALQKIEAGIKHLGTSPPMQPMVDAGSERVRVLLQLGLRDRAKQEFRKIEALIHQNPDAIILEQQESLRMEIESFELPLQDWLERWESSPHGRAIWKRLSLRSGMVEASDELRTSHSSYTLGRLAICEGNLVRALGQSDSDAIWHGVSEMEKALQDVTEPCSERIALALVQAGLAGDQGEDLNRKESFFRQVEIDLLRWGCDLEVKAPLQAWLQSARQAKSGVLPEKDPLWRKTSAGDRDRWKRWWSPFWKEAAKKFRVYTSKGSREADLEPTAKDLPKGLFASDVLADVVCNGRRIKELSSRHSLRRLLTLLLECSPESASKATLAGTVWGESYNPQIHDSRIYTAVQRLRALIKLKDPIQSSGNGYRWNPALPFLYVRPAQQEGPAGGGNPRVQGLLLHALESFSQSGRPWVSRSDLVEVAGASDATVKRELARLLADGNIRRRGAGRAVEYSKT